MIVMINVGISNEEASSQVWGLSEAFDWLAINCTSDEMLGFDDRRRTAGTDIEDNDEDTKAYPSLLASGTRRVNSFLCMLQTNHHKEICQHNCLYSTA